MEDTEDASVDDERFGALRLPRGGKHGYRGVRGGQGKKRDRFQAYTTVASTKVTVPGLFRSVHEAAVALALWKQQRKLGINEEPAPKKARKKRSSALAERPSTCGSAGDVIQLPRMPVHVLWYTRFRGRGARTARLDLARLHDWPPRLAVATSRHRHGPSDPLRGGAPNDGGWRWRVVDHHVGTATLLRLTRRTLSAALTLLHLVHDDLHHLCSWRPPPHARR